MNLGAKIGIGIGCGAAGAVGGLIFWFVKRKKKKKEEEAVKTPEEAPSDDIPEFKYEVERIERKPDLGELVKDLGYKKAETDIPFEVNDNLPKFQAIDSRDSEWEPGEMITLHYYEDDILTTDDTPPHILTKEEIIDNVGNFKKHIGEFEKDYCVIRNNSNHLEYEIVVEPISFRQKLADNPKWSDDE